MGKLWRWLKSLFGFGDNTPKNPDGNKRKAGSQFPPDVPPAP